MAGAQAAFNNRKKFGCLGAYELRRLKRLEEEDTRLQRLVADLSQDEQMLLDLLKKQL
ncbi:hypothetical protein [Pandoraea anhela]|uniref:hypothetical protein n=1 Tax=Pandoraea anhela TaxID=2508295 RepID=UPI001581F72B|nr:hypothetical protein [Pandoraea anhela]